MMRFAIVLLGLLAFQSSRAAVTITMPVAQLYSGYLFGIEFEIPSLNIGEPSMKTDFLDEVTSAKIIQGTVRDGTVIEEIFPPSEDGFFYWFSYLNIDWTGVRSETSISGQVLLGTTGSHHYGRIISFWNGNVRCLRVPISRLLFLVVFPASLLQAKL